MRGTRSFGRKARNDDRTVNTNALILFGVPVLAGAMLGYLCGGTLTALSSSRMRLRRIWLLWLAAALQIAQLSTAAWPAPYGSRARTPFLAATFATALVWLAVNTPHRPWALQLSAWAAMAGGTLNAVAIAVNGRMPYSTQAAAEAGLRPGATTAKNAAATAHTHLRAIGDIIPIPPVHAVISIGDLLIVAGVIGIIAIAMQPAAPHEQARGVAAQSPI